ncbi:MAG: sugar phosphate isomerase/epimerase [Phycisphaeraceae bacterium]|nr:sugar phosphate isomerase/epimerase [Phycisphaeraceae bacterium]
MPMQLALSALALPSQSIEDLCKSAQAAGCDAVELWTTSLGVPDDADPSHALPGGIASDPATLDPQRVQQAATSAGLRIAALSAAVGLHAKDAAAARRQIDQAVRLIHLAKQIGAPAVRLWGGYAARGQTKLAAAQRIAMHTQQVLAATEPLGVRLLFENTRAPQPGQISLSEARDWWSVLEMAGHPLAGLCWNLAGSGLGAAWELPVISVPMLGSRIAMVRLGGPGWAGQDEPGEPQAKELVQRLRGVGYESSLVVAGPWWPVDANQDRAATLKDAADRLRSWLVNEAAAPKSAKPAHTPAAAPGTAPGGGGGGVDKEALKAAALEKAKAIAAAKAAAAAAKALS